MNIHMNTHKSREESWRVKSMEKSAGVSKVPSCPCDSNLAVMAKFIISMFLQIISQNPFLNLYDVPQNFTIFTFYVIEFS